MVLMGGGLFAYISIFATANVRHDYYQMFLIPFVAIALGVGYDVLSRTGWFGKTAACFMAVMGIGMSLYQVHGFYQINNYAAVEAGEAVAALVPADALIVAPYNKDMTLLYHTNRKGWPFVDGSLDELVAKGASVYVSTNFADPDTQYVQEHYAVLVQELDYIVADLTTPK